MVKGYPHFYLHAGCIPPDARRAYSQAFQEAAPFPRQSEFWAPSSMFGGFGSFQDLSFPGMGGMRSSIDHSDFFRR